MKKILLTAIIILSGTLITKAEMAKDSLSDTIGIRFEQTLKWSEILAKAKAEHKYIFVDCYATWCGPCKWMEANVYTQKQVADVYNKDFIAVKIQMDKTVTDDSLTKVRYDRAKTFEQNYHVESYPTFLFFDPDGNPVHKVSGSFDVNGFIQLAADAQNSYKQYYAILKNFQPGKLDTADEKGLVTAFAFTDKALAAKIAADYLARIPRSRLKLRFSGGLMQRFQDDPQVFAVAIDYLNSLNKAEFAEEDNVNILRALIQKPQVQDIVVDHIKGLTAKETGQPDNLDFIAGFWNNPEVQRIAQKYIDRLSESEMYKSSAISFIGAFTHTAQDRGFKFFYGHAARIDMVMKSKEYAQGKIQYWISNTEWQPELETAKKTGVTPDFEKIAATISGKYNAQYAEEIITDARIDWYGYLVNQKKTVEYWPEFLHWRMIRIEKIPRPDWSAFDVNNLCYDIFKHSEEQSVLDTAAQWMKDLVYREPNDIDEHDTYACVLYKDGKKAEGIAFEQKLIDRFVSEGKAPKKYIDVFRKKVELMKSGGSVWLLPEFQ